MIWGLSPACLSQGFTAEKRHHDHSKSYKRQHCIGAGLHFERLSPLSLSWQETSQHAGRHGAGEGAESSSLHLESQAEGNYIPHWEELEHISELSKPTSRMTQLLTVPLPMAIHSNT